MNFVEMEENDHMKKKVDEVIKSSICKEEVLISQNTAQPVYQSKFPYSTTSVLTSDSAQRQDTTSNSQTPPLTLICGVGTSIALT